MACSRMLFSPTMPLTVSAGHYIKQKLVYPIETFIKYGKQSDYEKPEYCLSETYTELKEVVEQIKLIYRQSGNFLRKAFSKAPWTTGCEKRYRAFYPEIGIQIDRFA